MTKGVSLTFKFALHPNQPFVWFDLDLVGGFTFEIVSISEKRSALSVVELKAIKTLIYVVNFDQSQVIDCQGLLLGTL